MLLAAKRLTEKGYDIRFFCFDQQTDKQYMERMSQDYPMHIWDPLKANYSEMLENLKACSLIVASRAHGAIVGACLNIPTVCIRVEPKLSRVAEMLKQSAVLVTVPIVPERLVSIVLDRMDRLDELRRGANADVTENAGHVQRALDQLKNVLDEVSFS